MYLNRQIDKYLTQWAEDGAHKPLLLRGARQVGKSKAVEHLGQSFKYFVKIDFERNPEYSAVFKGNHDVQRIVPQLSAICGLPIVEGKTLLFFDEIQECQEAIMTLRYFKEDMPGLHVVAAGSLLEFALEDMPTFGVGRIHSMFMYPLSFDEFLVANGQEGLLKLRQLANPTDPLSDAVMNKLIESFRTYMLIGGMPEVVVKWVTTKDIIKCQEIQDDILMGYESDFSKYKKRVAPELLRNTLRSAALQISNKFVYSKVRSGWRTEEVKSSLDLLYKAGILIPVSRSDANGLPLGAQSDDSYRKVLIMDSGLLLRLQNMELGNSQESATQILTSSVSDLVNKGPLAEMIAGLEMIKYKTPNRRHDLYYWTRKDKNSQAEIDYVAAMNQNIVPIEVKAEQKGGMKSLWIFMRDKGLKFAYRCSLENFGSFTYVDALADGAVREVEICPLYAMSQL